MGENWENMCVCVCSRFLVGLGVSTFEDMYVINVGVNSIFKEIV